MGIYMHVGIIEFLNLNAYQICKNKGYAPGLALGRRKVRGVSRGQLLELLQYKDFLLVLLDDLLEVLLLRGHVLNHLVIYMHAMITPHLKR
jgi:hypothetical protein